MTWIAVVFDESPGNDAVIEVALNEAALRTEPVMALVVWGGDLAENDEPEQLAVIGANDANQVATLIGPHGHPILRHARCSVLVVRH